MNLAYKKISQLFNEGNNITYYYDQVKDQRL